MQGHSPQPNGQQVRQQQRRKEDFEKLGRKDTPLLHDARVPHAEGGCALWVPEQELPAEGREVSLLARSASRLFHDAKNRLTWGGCFRAGLTSPISSLSFSLGCFRLLSFSQCNLPQTKKK